MAVQTPSTEKLHRNKASLKQKVLKWLPIGTLILLLAYNTFNLTLSEGGDRYGLDAAPEGAASQA